MSDKVEKARDRAVYDSTEKVIDALIAAVREEQAPAVKRLRERMNRIEEEIPVPPNDGSMTLIDMIRNLRERAEQQIGHVANCRCHGENTPDYYELCRQECGKQQAISHEHNHTDPRCVPGVLALAKARLDTLLDVRCIHNAAEDPDWADGNYASIETRLRAEVEKLEKESS